MNFEESLKVTSLIGKAIASGAPQITCSPEELAAARAGYSEEKLAELEKLGFYHGDFQLFYTVKRLADTLDLWKVADGDYLKKLFSLAKKFDRDAFYRDPYLEKVKIREKKSGDVLLTHATYAKGEFFQYDMPRLREELVVPRLGFFTEEVSFPAVYEGVTPWVSVCPSEIYSMQPDVAPAFGRVLVLGLGLGYYPFLISEKRDVEKITIVEKNPHIIELFSREILPQFPFAKKIRIVQADAFEFLENTEAGAFDFCYADIWEGWVDGSAAMKRIEPHEKRLYSTEFRYWIGDEIRWWQENAEEA